MSTIKNSAVVECSLVALNESNNVFPTVYTEMPFIGFSLSRLYVITSHQRVKDLVIAFFTSIAGSLLHNMVPSLKSWSIRSSYITQAPINMLRPSMRPQYRSPVKRKYFHTRPKFGKNDISALKTRQESLRKKTLTRRNRAIDR